MRPYRIQIIRHKPKFVDFEKLTDKQNQKIAEHDQTNLMRSNLLCQQFLKHSQDTTTNYIPKIPWFNGLDTKDQVN